MPTTDPKLRFTSRVENYARFRPGYPRAIVEHFRDECGLSPGWAIADVGSGTGLLAILFLEFGCVVYGVEPNPAMRAAGERELARFPQYRSVSGSAEASTLPGAAVDLVAAGQAFHWFDHSRSRAEFSRILKTGGWVAIVSNDRRLDSSLMADYEHLLERFGTDFSAVRERHPSREVLLSFFGHDAFRESRFDNAQEFDWPGLQGRLLSASYAPEEGHPNHRPMMEELQRIFAAHEKGGRIRFEYDTWVITGQMRAAR